MKAWEIQKTDMILHKDRIKAVRSISYEPRHRTNPKKDPFEIITVSFHDGTFGIYRDDDEVEIFDSPKAKSTV